MLRRGDGGAAHFGGDVVALEKDEVFKRERVHGEYSTRPPPPTPPHDFYPRTLLRDARRERAETICKHDNVQMIPVFSGLYI